MSFLTIPDVLTQVLGSTVVASLSDATDRQAAELIRAVNKGVAEWFELAPDSWRRTTLSHHFKPPETLTGIAITKGNVIVDSGTPFTADHRSQTIKLNGDGNIWNEVVSTTSVLIPYLGTENPTTATVYFDGVVFRDLSMIRVVSDPKCQQTGHTLTNVPNNTAIGSHGHGFTGIKRHGYGSNDPWAWRSVGTYPDIYKVDYIGNSVVSDDDALFVLRVDPMPTVDCTITFEADYRPKVYTIADLHEATQIPIDTTLAHTLLPLIEDRLTRSPIWDEARDKRAVWEEKNDAKRFIEKGIGQRFITQRRQARTKRGF